MPSRPTHARARKWIARHPRLKRAGILAGTAGLVALLWHASPKPGPIRFQPEGRSYEYVIQEREKGRELFPYQRDLVNLNRPLWSGRKIDARSEKEYCVPGNLVRVTLQDKTKSYFLILPASESTTYYLLNYEYQGSLHRILEDTHVEKVEIFGMRKSQK